MVIGAISFIEPLYSPISSSVSEVLFKSSVRHCLAETVLVTRINVLVLATAMVAAPTIVLPAPQGKTTTPEPPSQNFSTAASW